MKSKVENGMYKVMHGHKQINTASKVKHHPDIFSGGFHVCFFSKEQ